MVMECGIMQSDNDNNNNFEVCEYLIYDIEVRTGEGEYLCNRPSYTKCKFMKDGSCPICIQNL